MELIITTTLLRAWPRGVPDSFGTIIHDADHRGEFAFRRGVSPKADGADPEDDFARADIDARLGLAARCTASFPVAFEAAYVPVGNDTSAFPDMEDHANFQGSRFVIDGGVLANRPLRPALRAIFRQPATKQVRRVLAYVVPDPGEAVTVEPDEESMAPTLADVGLASMIRLPRNQSVSAELEELTLHNARVDAKRRRRELLVLELDVDDLARRIYVQYRGFRADLIADWLFRLLARGFTALEEKELDLVGEAPLRERDRLRAELSAHLESLPPDEFPTGHVERWFTTVDTAERAAEVVLDLLRRGLGVVDPSQPDSAGVRRRLRDLRGGVCRQLTRAQATRERLTKDDELRLAREAVQALRAGQLAEWADQTLPRVLGDWEALAPIIGELAGHLLPAADAVREACEYPAPHLGRRADDTRRFADALTRGLKDDPRRDKALLRLLALEVVQLTLGGEPIVEQRVDLIQVSADAGNGLDLRERAEDKLAGLQLGHFGAFYKRSWRASDWMWGRHDAAQRLAQVLIEPARLRQLGYDVEHALKEIEDIAFGDLAADEEAVLRTATPRPWDAEIAAHELAFLENEQVTPPTTLPMCAQAVARRLQLGILATELRDVAEAVAWDQADGAHVDAAAQHFCREVQNAPEPIPPVQAVELFKACRIGQERIAAEAGSDLLARTATRTFAVTTAATAGNRSGLPKRVRPALGTLRGLGLMVHLFVRYALERHHTSAMLATGALFAGAALVGVGLVVDIPGILMLVGLGALLGGVGVAIYREGLVGGMKVLGALAIGLLVALLPRLVGWVWDLSDDDEQRVDDVWQLVDRVEPLLVVGGLLVAAYFLGKLSVAWPETDAERRARRRQSDVPTAPPGSVMLFLGVMLGAVNEFVNWIPSISLAWVGGAGAALVAAGALRLWWIAERPRDSEPPRG